MKRQKYASYIAAGVTAFLVIAAALLLAFALLRFERISSFCATLSDILRPVTFGLVLAFLLLPVHRNIYGFLSKIKGGVLCATERRKSITGLAAILLSLLVLFVAIYLLLAMLIPQVYVSVVGLIRAMPDYIRSAQSWLQEFLKNNLTCRRC